jgi:hypothetical protein
VQGLDSASKTKIKFKNELLFHKFISPRNLETSVLISSLLLRADKDELLPTVFGELFLRRLREGSGLLELSEAIKRKFPKSSHSVSGILKHK